MTHGNLSGEIVTAEIATRIKPLRFCVNVMAAIQHQQ